MLNALTTRKNKLINKCIEICVMVHKVVYHDILCVLEKSVYPAAVGW